ncbi:hypothetical protein ACQP00_08815 [Dactylosporangium sp. CS-047395]|uniref:hypothetical protein n=1 Tax=Dactylosporangium sp. CS-047395 TaxID=3239936 RepID=UPI003D8BAA11
MADAPGLTWSSGASGGPLDQLAQPLGDHAAQLEGVALLEAPVAVLFVLLPEPLPDLGIVSSARLVTHGFRFRPAEQ